MTLPGPPSDPWNRLAEAAGSIFATKEWAECWWNHYGGPSTPVIVADSDQNPTYVLPLYLSKGPLRRLRFIGHGPADQLGAVCGAQAIPEASEKLKTILAGQGLAHDVFLAQDVLEAEGWDARLDGTVVRHVASPIVRLETDDWDAFLAQKSKNFREQTRRRERKLEKAFSARFRLSDRSSLDADLTALFRLHSERWNEGAPFASGLEKAFHEEFACAALRQGWLRLWMLELDGRPVAALYGFRFAGVEYFHQSGRDPKFEEHSVGSVLLTHSIRTALQDGMREYRLLRGDESYKSRFADADRDVHTVAVARTLRGKVAIAAAPLRGRR